MARWVATYVVPLDVGRGQVSREEIDVVGKHGSQHSRKLLNSFAWENNQGEFVLDFVVLISMVALTTYQGENELQVTFAFTNQTAILHKFVRPHVCACLRTCVLQCYLLLMASLCKNRYSL